MMDYITNASDLAADYKNRGMNKYRAWDQFVIDRGLKPEMNAKDFYEIFAFTTAKPLVTYTRPLNFNATHFDNYLKKEVSIIQDGLGVFNMVWEDGRTGSNPPIYPPDPDRYIKMENS